MHFQSFITVAVSTLAVVRANPLEVRDTAAAQNLRAIQAAFQAMGQDMAAVEQAVQQLSATNAASQVPVISSKLITLSNDASAQAKKINASGAIGIFEMTGLLNQNSQQQFTTLIKGFTTPLNNTVSGIQAKKEIIRNSGKLDGLEKAIRAQKKGVLDIASTIPGQIPAAILKQVQNMASKAASSAAATGAAGSAPRIPDINDPKLKEEISKQVDGLIDQAIGILRGTQESFTVPPLPSGITIPAGLAKGLGGAAGVPKTAAPKATGAPKAAPRPKAAPKAAAPKAAATGAA